MPHEKHDSTYDNHYRHASTDTPQNDPYPIFAHRESKLVRIHRYGFIAPVFFTDTRAHFPRTEKIKSIVMMMLALGIFIEYIVLLLALIAYNFSYDRASMVVIIACYALTFFPLTYYVAKTAYPGVVNLVMSTTSRRNRSVQNYLPEQSRRSVNERPGVVVCAMPHLGATKKERDEVSSKMELAAMAASMNKDGMDKNSKISRMVTILAHHYEAQSNASKRTCPDAQEWERKEKRTYQDFFDEMVDNGTSEIDAAFVDAAVPPRTT